MFQFHSLLPEKYVLLALKIMFLNNKNYFYFYQLDNIKPHLMILDNNSILYEYLRLKKKKI